jgi:nucleoside-diphosphate-sugar epimerase
LLAKGHAVVALTRSPDKVQALVEQGIEPAIADVFDADAVKAVVGRARPEVVIEQLTALPKTYTRESMSAAAVFNARIRLEGGANVLEAAQAAGVQRYLRQSVAFWAIPGLGLADEETPLALDASPAVAAEARVITELERRLLGDPNIEGIALRYGFFYGPGTWFHPDGDVAQQVRQQRFPIVGSGDGVWSWLHIEDAAIATVSAAERGHPGIYLITNDQPLAMRKWLPAFAQWLNAPPPPEISVEDAMKASGGADAVYYGTRMRGVSNAKAKRDLYFRPRPLKWVVDAALAQGIHPAKYGGVIGGPDQTSGDDGRVKPGGSLRPPGEWRGARDRPTSDERPRICDASRG